MPYLTAAGVSDQVFLATLRSDLRDAPLPYKNQISADGSSFFYRVNQVPMYDGDLYATTPLAPQFSIAVGGTLQTLKGDWASIIGSSGQVFVDYESGYLYWGTAPASGTNNIVIFYRKCVWTDRQMLTALYAGLRAMFPWVWQWRNDTSITMATNVWDYNLPLDPFGDPRVRITRVEMREIPAATERYRVVDSWRRINNTTIQLPISQWFTPGATLRVTYVGPVSSLSDLDAASAELPILYAKWQLLSNKEAPRVRSDSVPQVQAENANPVGAQMQTAQGYLAQFRALRNELQMPFPYVQAMTPSYLY